GHHLGHTAGPRRDTDLDCRGPLRNLATTLEAIERDLAHAIRVEQETEAHLLLYRLECGPECRFQRSPLLEFEACRLIIHAARLVDHQQHVGCTEARFDRGHAAFVETFETVAARDFGAFHFASSTGSVAAAAVAHVAAIAHVEVHGGQATCASARVHQAGIIAALACASQGKQERRKPDPRNATHYTHGAFRRKRLFVEPLVGRRHAALTLVLDIRDGAFGAGAVCGWGTEAVATLFYHARRAVGRVPIWRAGIRCDLDGVVAGHRR